MYMSHSTSAWGIPTKINFSGMPAFDDGQNQDVEGPRRLKDRRDSEKGFQFQSVSDYKLKIFLLYSVCISFRLLVESRRNYLGFESEIEMNHSP